MRNLIIISIFISILVIGCSGRLESPVNPSANRTSPESSLLNEEMFSDNLPGSIGFPGTWELIIHPDEISAELISGRSSAIGEDYIVSGKAFFTISPCQTCLKISSISLDADNNVVLTFAIEHPFMPGDLLKPPSGLNRLDLDIFDVALIIAPSQASPEEYALTGAQAYAGYCVHPDGYTTELENFTGDDGALPYYLVIDDSDSGVSSFNKFAMGESAAFDTVFNPASGSFTFDLFLTMGYGSSAKKPSRLAPKYYNPEFNRKPAWKVEVIPPEGDNPPVVGNTWMDSSTDAHDVTVKVYDWQQGVDVSTTIPYDDEPDTSLIFAASNVSQVTVEVPGMSSSLPTSTTPASGAGTPDDPLIYTVSVPNDNLLAAGEYNSLVKVSDERIPMPTALGRDFLIDTPNGINLNNYEIPEYATYQVFTATVVVGCGPITGQITSPSCPVSGVSNGETRDFTVSASSGNGGDPIVLYEVDYDYNGTSFASDASSVNGTFNDVGPFDVPDPCTSNIPYTFTVAFRATDSCDPANQTIFATCEVTVDSCFVTDVGNVWITVNRVPSQNTISNPGPMFDPNGAWTLHWDSVPGAVQYAIYYDNNPGNYSLPSWNQSELTNSLSQLGVTTSTTYTVAPSHLPSNHYLVGNTYIVRARTVMNNPGSETGDSEPAFIMVNGWETAPVQAVILNPAQFEGWQAGWETSNAPPTHPWYYYPVTDNFYQNISQGYANARISSCYIGDMSVVGRWTSCVKRTPVVPDADVRFIDAALQPWSSNYTTPAKGGVIVGTCSIMPGHPWTTPVDFEWAHAESTAPFNGYDNSQDTYLYTLFEGVNTSSAWCWKCPNFYVEDEGRRIGCDVNSAGGDPDDPFIGYAAAKSSYSIMDHDNWFSDEIAIMIY
jgi:hypothetical protein